MCIDKFRGKFDQRKYYRLYNHYIKQSKKGMYQKEIEKTCDRRPRANSTDCKQIQLSLISQDSFEEGRAQLSMVDSNAAFTLNTEQMRNSEYSTEHEQFRYIVYKAIIYVRKQLERNMIDDGMMAEEIGRHICIGSNPTPLTSIGEKLLKNGYVLVAYSILMGRLHKSEFYFKYLINAFDSSNDINEHFQEFKHYFNRSSQSFGIPASKQKPNSQRQKNHEVLKRSNCNEGSPINNKNVKTIF